MLGLAEHALHFWLADVHSVYVCAAVAPASRWLRVQAIFGKKARFVVEEVEEPTLFQQAAIYYNASIVIQMHGAALGELAHQLTKLSSHSFHAHDADTTMFVVSRAPAGLRQLVAAHAVMSVLKCSMVRASPLSMQVHMQAT